MNTLTDTTVPSWIAAVLGVATLVMLASLVLLLKGRARRSAPSSRDEKAIRRLFIAALIPSLLVIGAVMAISFVGLASFAQTDMGWHSWIRFIVPVSLDGISITFGFWAFVAVKRGRHPGRSERIVYVGALISAWINYNHGREAWTGAAGIYLGFLSLASAWMFHELLSQFMDAQDAMPKARRVGTPLFGERWIWAPWSTLMARRAWVVYPPSPDVESTAANALAHLDAVRVYRNRAARKLRHQANVDAIRRELHNANTPTNLPVFQADLPAKPIIPTIPVPSTRIMSGSEVDTGLPVSNAATPATTDPTPTTAIATVTAGDPTAGVTPVVDRMPVPSPADVASRVTAPANKPSRTGSALASGPVQRSAPPRTNATRNQATPLNPSAAGSSAAERDGAQLAIPMASPQLLARAAEEARLYHAENGAAIKPGQLARRLKVSSVLAADLLASVHDTPTTPAVNGARITA